jgi:hypothetical protein
VSSPSANAGVALQSVVRAVRGYLAARDQAVVAGANAQLASYLQVGSPAAAVEPLAAQGKVIKAAQRGLLYVQARTSITLPSRGGQEAVSFYSGATPVGIGDLPAAPKGLRAIVTCATTTRLVANDGSTTTTVAKHTVTLVAAGSSRWLVYEDDYADTRQADYLAAAGAPPWQVVAARRRAAHLAAVERRCSTAGGAVRAYVELLNDRRYLEANFCLDPSSGATSQGMGATFRRMRVVAVRPVGRQISTQAELQVTLNVLPAAGVAVWNKGTNNTRFYLLRRTGANRPWSIVAVNTSP